MDNLEAQTLAKIRKQGIIP